MENIQNNLGSSIWGILIYLLWVMSLSFLAIWSFQANSIKGLSLVVVFGLMTIFGTVMSKGEFFNLGTWSENSFSFMTGFLIFITIKASTTLSVVFSVTKNALFADIAGELPIFLEFLTNTFLIPISEEIFWMIGIPFTMFTLLNIASKNKNFAFLENKLLQISLVALVTMITFATFHVGISLTTFLIAAMSFRLINVLVVIGDAKFDWVKSFRMLPSFAIGAHIGNNWGDFGFIKGLNLLWQNFDVGIIVIILFAIMFVSFINQIMLWVLKLRDKVMV